MGTGIDVSLGSDEYFTKQKLLDLIIIIVFVKIGKQSVQKSSEAMEILWSNLFMVFLNLVEQV